MVATGVCVALKSDGVRYRRAIRAPEGSELAVSLDDGYATVVLPELRGYQL